MTDRHTINSINSDQLDALYDRIECFEAELARMRERAEVTSVRVRNAAALHRQGLITTAALYAVIETDPEPSTAATEATEPSAPTAVHSCGQTPHTWGCVTTVAHEAIRQMDADPHGLKAGMIVQPYHEHGEQKWVFRCWGTDTCDGLLSLDHYSEQAAERARDRHLAEDHQEKH